MKCTICKNGDILSGFTTVTLQRAETTINIKQVPAEICDYGESII
jgi:YgiT-type zinc finger domain-containing protein